MAGIGGPGRDYFGSYLNRRRLLGTAVEIGTHRGVFALTLRRTWRGKVLFCVDPWINGYDPDDPASLGDRDTDKQLALRRLRPWISDSKCELLHMTSKQAATQFSNGSVDFVYIDAVHKYESVFEDLGLWWPKVKKGGILAGHDFICPGAIRNPRNRLGYSKEIQPAVMDFVSRLPEPPIIWLVQEKSNQNWSFYLDKETES